MCVSIIGNIGAGKSTLLKELSSKGYKVVFEPVDQWTFLPQFYKNMKRWSFTLQVEILHSFHNLNTKNAIVERSPWEATNIFARNLYENEYMTLSEYNLIQNMTNRYKMPELFVYLKSTPSTCIERIKKRNRTCETSISEEYISKLHTLYEASVKELEKSNNVIHVCANQSKEELCKQVIEKINIYNNNAINS
jgi:deoxyadenosine/deoxycytidine kinase